jgi:hypothetical protein
MAKALKSDLVNSPRWTQYAEAARRRGDAFYPQKCPNCEVEYTIFLAVMEDAEPVVHLLREYLPHECPEHQPEIYTINEGPSWGRIIEGMFDLMPKSFRAVLKNIEFSK